MVLTNRTKYSDPQLDADGLSIMKRLDKEKNHLPSWALTLIDEFEKNEAANRQVRRKEGDYENVESSA